MFSRNTSYIVVSLENRSLVQAKQRATSVVKRIVSCELYASRPQLLVINSHATQLISPVHHDTRAKSRQLMIA